MKKISMLTAIFAMVCTIGFAQNDTEDQDFDRGNDRTEEYTDDSGQYSDQETRDYSDETEKFSEETGEYTEDKAEKYADDSQDMMDRHHKSMEESREGYSEKSRHEYGSDNASGIEKSWENNQSTDDVKASGKVEDLVRNTLEHGMMEAEMAQLALQQDDAPEEIEEFAGEVMDDHRDIMQLTNIAKSMNVEIPEELNREDLVRIDKFRDLDGDDYNEEFIKRMVEDNQSIINRFEQVRNEVTDRELSSWIDDTLPLFKDHLEKARDIQAKIDAGELDEDDGLF